MSLVLELLALVVVVQHAPGLVPLRVRSARGRARARARGRAHGQPRLGVCDRPVRVATSARPFRAEPVRRQVRLRGVQRLRDRPRDDPGVLRRLLGSGPVTVGSLAGPVGHQPEYAAVVAAHRLRVMDQGALLVGVHVVDARQCRDQHLGRERRGRLLVDQPSHDAHLHHERLQGGLLGAESLLTRLVGRLPEAPGARPQSTRGSQSSGEQGDE